MTSQAGTRQDRADRIDRADHADDRQESSTERMDRHWAELLQELRVTQTGVQLLTAFLLSLPFQQRFTRLTHDQKMLYLVVVVLSVSATAFVIMPVSLHRAVFRLHDRERLIRVADATAKLGLALLGLAVTGVVTLIFDVTVGRTAAIIAGAATLAVFTLLWLIIPMLLRHGAEKQHKQGDLPPT